MLMFNQRNRVSAACFYITSTYLSGCSFMYVCVPCYCHICYYFLNPPLASNIVKPNINRNGYNKFQFKNITNRLKIDFSR